MPSFLVSWTAGEVVTPYLEGKPSTPAYTTTSGFLTIHAETKEQAEKQMKSLLATTTRPYRSKHPDCKVTVTG